MKRSLLVSLAVTLLLISSSPSAASQPLTVVPGKAVGPVRLGMTAIEVLRVLGQPSSRAPQEVWVYEAPFKIRVEFKEGRTSTITTWDTRVRTPDGLGVGSPQAAVIRGLGGSPSTAVGESGVWFFNDRLGLAVFVRGGIATAFAVMLPQTQARVPAPPQAAPLVPTPRPTQTQETRSQPATSAPAVVIENLSHEVDATVKISGTLRNVGQYPRLYVAIVVSAETFRGGPSDPKRIIAARHLEPGAHERFTVDLGKDLWKSYTVKVDSYSPMQSGDPRASASGFVNRNEYLAWAGEDLRSYVKASASRAGSGIWVSYAGDFPRYANVRSVVIRVGYSTATTIRITEVERGLGGRPRLVQRDEWQTRQHQGTAFLSPTKPTDGLVVDLPAGITRCMSISQQQPGQCISAFSFSVGGVTVEEVNWSLNF